VIRDRTEVDDRGSLVVDQLRILLTVAASPPEVDGIAMRSVVWTLPLHSTTAGEGPQVLFAIPLVAKVVRVRPTSAISQYRLACVIATNATLASAVAT
jgi:hypothetical protein